MYPAVSGCEYQVLAFVLLKYTFQCLYMGCEMISTHGTCICVYLLGQLCMYISSRLLEHFVTVL